ncbi:UDP-N-acetylglucosamine transporter-like [Mya arenaria]|uniref:UDP-N-acetylglucosamine transporter-like n=1 Tax=Mya arenaria TaxID=6604 RepID=UPI0022E35693|nr:UDP-N-acetylglucosamine transporter-like [Mya arenaria]
MSGSLTVQNEKERDLSMAIRSSHEGPTYMVKYLSLLALVGQNAMVILVMRYVRTRGGDMFMATSAVVMSEILKCATSMLIIFYLHGSSFRRWAHHLHENILLQPGDCVKVSVPSLVYTLQNNLLYIALSNLDAATFQVTYQLKILTTAVFSVIMLRKVLSGVQWISLVILFVGVSIVQLQPESETSLEANEQRPLLGLVAVVVSCLMSGFAGVYFEKILKESKQSLWLRNVQLGFLGAIIGMITMEIKEGDRLRLNGFFHGYDAWVWLVIILQSLGGLLVAIVVKYADNILKGFAASMAIVVSCIVSVFFFDFKLSFQFTFGASLVMLSIYLYGRYVPKPMSQRLEKISTL